MTRTPTAAEEAIDTALVACRRARVAAAGPGVPQAASEAVHDAIAALECGLDVLADLAAIGGESLSGCSCGAPGLEAMTPGESVVHRAGAPCYIVVQEVGS